MLVQAGAGWCQCKPRNCDPGGVSGRRMASRLRADWPAQLQRATPSRSRHRRIPHPSAGTHAGSIAALSTCLALARRKCHPPPQMSYCVMPNAKCQMPNAKCQHREAVIVPCWCLSPDNVTLLKTTLVLYTHAPVRHCSETSRDLSARPAFRHPPCVPSPNSDWSYQLRGVAMCRYQPRSDLRYAQANFGKEHTSQTTKRSMQSIPPVERMSSTENRRLPHVCASFAAIPRTRRMQVDRL
jgi:hypothetical protein